MRRTAAAIVIWLALAAPAWGANLKGIIYAAPNNGPYVYTFEVEGALKYNVNGIASASAAFDSLKVRVGNEGGTILKVTFRTNTTTKEMFAVLRPTVNNGPFAYYFVVDGEWKNFVNGVGSIGAGADAVRTLVAGEGGTFVKSTITVTTQ